MFKTSIAKLSGCLILLCTVVSANAQFGIFKDIDEIEVIAGPSVVTFGGEDWESNKIKIGYSAGLGAAWKLKGRSSVAVKLLSERKGIKFSAEVYYYDADMQQHRGTASQITNLDYLSLPLTFQYQIGQADKKGFIIEGGLYFSYLYKAQSISKYSWRSKEVYNRKDDFKSTDYGFALGFGYRLKLKNNFSIKLWSNATYGVSSIGKKSGATAFLNARNQSFGIGVALIKFR